jgi:hypothetical protein
MPVSANSPAWARELALAYESGAYGQFVLYGNVHDRMAVGNELVNLGAYLENELLAAFVVVFSYDLGNGLTIERGGEIIEKWGGANLDKLPSDPLASIQYVGRYLKYLGNLRALRREASSSSFLRQVRATNMEVSRACYAIGRRSRHIVSCRLRASWSPTI